MNEPNAALRELLDRREIYDLALRYARAVEATASIRSVWISTACRSCVE